MDQKNWLKSHAIVKDTKYLNEKERALKKKREKEKKEKKGK